MEILSDQDIESLQKTINIFSSEFSFNKFDNEEMQKALNTIKLQRQQLAQREAEVSEAVAIVNQLRLKHSYNCKAEETLKDSDCGCSAGPTNEWIDGQLSDLPAKAEAHNAKVREEAIRECIKVTEATIDGSKDWPSVKYELEALLNKPESEGV